jgi:cytoskeletal protein CcmA (bactofilin family)
VDRPFDGILAEGAQHVGDLVFSGPARIDGLLEGSLRSDHLVEVGQHGRVEGKVVARQALIAGTIVGVLQVTERATLLPTAQIIGTLLCPWLDVRSGAIIEAQVVAKRDA